MTAEFFNLRVLLMKAFILSYKNSFKTEFFNFCTFIQKQNTLITVACMRNHGTTITGTKSHVTYRDQTPGAKAAYKMSFEIATDTKWASFLETAARSRRHEYTSITTENDTRKTICSCNDRLLLQVESRHHYVQALNVVMARFNLKLIISLLYARMSFWRRHQYT